MSKARRVGGYNGASKLVGPIYHSVTKFEPPSPTECKASGHYYVFCPHNRLYITTCTKCGRDRAAAIAHAKSMGIGITI